MKRSPTLRYWLVLLLVTLVWVYLFANVLFAMLYAPSLGNLLAMGILVYVGTAMRETYRALNPARIPSFQPTKEEIGFTYGEITFSSRGRIQLSGWITEPENGAMIILVHGYNSTRTGVLPIARILAQAGYGVLLFDLRAHGQSAGKRSTFGWRETDDLLGAVDAAQREFPRARVGVWGHSLGGQIALRTAAQTDIIQAAAVDGASPATLPDHPFPAGFSLRKLAQLPWLWIVYNFQAILLGSAQPAGVLESVGSIAPCPLLFISCGKRNEQRSTRAFYEAAGKPKTLFEIPEGVHGGGLRARPDEYQKQLLGFFEGALLK